MAEPTGVGAVRMERYEWMPVIFGGHGEKSWCLTLHRIRRD